MAEPGLDSLNARRTLAVGGREYHYYSLPDAADAGLGDIHRLPFSLKVLLENLLRHEDGTAVELADIKALANWVHERRSESEIAYHPARVLMQDFTGVPAIVDLAAMRDAMQKLGGDAKRINPLTPVDLVIDHSVTVDYFRSPDSYRRNVEMEFKRNRERYEFLHWGQKAFDNFRVVPPGTGICHQVNLEYLGQTVWTEERDGVLYAFPDTLVGMDSHTPMINALAVLGWGVGGIEAEAAMLGQPVSMLIPEVVGFKLKGSLKEGATATDLVLTVTQMLREKGVVGKFVEFYGGGVGELSIPDRATISNMSPEYGATCGFFPVDHETLNYLTFTGRDSHRVELVEAYAKAQGMWHDEDMEDPVFSDTLELDLSTVEPSLAGPKRPQDRVYLSQASQSFNDMLADTLHYDSVDEDAEMLEEGGGVDVGEAVNTPAREVAVAGTDYKLSHGDVVIAAITSCTNTSNPSVMLGAGLLARNAVARGLQVKPWVKTSLAPGSKVVSDYLAKAGVQDDLDTLGFNLVGYGCTTCIGNSGPLQKEIADAIEEGDVTACSVLSGNRNFEGRINPHVKANYLASPPLVVAYALAGNMRVDLLNDPLGVDKEGKPVYMKDIWPSNQEIQDTIRKYVTPEMFQERYSNVFEGPEEWRAIESKASLTYPWDDGSTYIQNPPHFEGMKPQPEPLIDIENARSLALLGDSITTDHISPAGSIAPDSPAGRYLIDKGVSKEEFNSFGSRRGNHEVMLRGTFGNIRLRNELVPGTSGGVARHMPDGEEMSIYDASMRYQKEGVPLVIVAGKEYGSGSSRDWAAKGTRLLGIKAVIAESYERIHRSNLVGMGVLPLQFKEGESRKTLKLDGTERFSVKGIGQGLEPGSELVCTITRADGNTQDIKVKCRIDTANELDYFRHGGILPYVLRKLMH